MHKLGETRSRLRHDHLLQTPDTFVRAALPGMVKSVAVVHAATALGAGFTQYTAEMEAGGRLGGAMGTRFLYVLEGHLQVDQEELLPGGYVLLPSGHPLEVTAKSASRVAVIEKEYVALKGVGAPQFFVGRESDIVYTPLMGDEDLQVRQLLPDDLALDFAVNTMTYMPGAALSMVEVHVMEHGLLMLEGGGIYRLGESWYPVTKGDFIWMAPYCPQWFGAIGKVPAKYLIYKDWNRHPLAARGEAR
ncbi:(S)-ureidoglycine aminohydrolase [Terriglobus saanensis]|uniref:Cupin 2 conserved barrel domain protein n=1 Tax=Terriglobus saanensis (strain ATCC BAA-1853 / DSM 23119 / SP1PR4) TaxID=401053 RepID=E8UY01_TERSS|nr:(S)-ureidoglycine aminohydrolase [Terriglobus saanensis]ADV84235.1 Cupin 2 conserved barrel domain protein [Terriglobus saanensis SP1PR4]